MKVILLYNATQAETMVSAGGLQHGYVEVVFTHHCWNFQFSCIYIAPNHNNSCLQVLFDLCSLHIIQTPSK